MDEQIKLNKLRIMLNAVESLEEDEPDFEGELVEAGWNILHENPGMDCQEWINELLRQYPTEVIDALGNNPHEVFHILTNWWECKEYEDAGTGECHSIKEWAEYFATDRSIELYDLLAEAKGEIKRLQPLSFQERPNPQPNPENQSKGHSWGKLRLSKDD